MHSQVHFVESALKCWDHNLVWRLDESSGFGMYENHMNIGMLSKISFTLNYCFILQTQL